MRKLPAFLILVSLMPSDLNAYQKGIALGLYAKDPAHSYESEIKEIKETGADHVSLVVSWYQKDIHAAEIYPRWERVSDFETVSDSKIVQVIRQAHRVGLKVFLFPILRIEERKEKEWRGSLEPRDAGEWLTSYRGFTLHYARLAAENGVELFSVGSELCSMENNLKFWKKLIAEIRLFYSGKLLYSANWDHYKKIKFWEDLDYLGLNGYYELADGSSPTIHEITKKWWEIENDITSWQERHRKKIIFTEIGYPSMDGGCRKPWDYTREAEVDLQEQALCYEAFFLSWKNRSGLAGVYFWNWYGQGGENDRTYTPRGKPAEEVLTKWFRSSSVSFFPHSSSSPAGADRPAVKSKAMSPPAPLPPS